MATCSGPAAREAVGQVLFKLKVDFPALALLDTYLRETTHLHTETRAQMCAAAFLVTAQSRQRPHVLTLVLPDAGTLLSSGRKRNRWERQVPVS